MQTLPAQPTETDQRLIKFPDAIAKGFFLLKDVLNRCIQLSGASGQKPQNDKFRRAAQIFKNFNRIW